jgi:hypothetical protein
MRPDRGFKLARVVGSRREHSNHWETCRLQNRIHLVIACLAIWPGVSRIVQFDDQPGPQSRGIADHEIAALTVYRLLLQTMPERRFHGG